MSHLWWKIQWSGSKSEETSLAVLQISGIRQCSRSTCLIHGGGAYSFINLRMNKQDVASPGKKVNNKLYGIIPVAQHLDVRRIFEKCCLWTHLLCYQTIGRLLGVHPCLEQHLVCHPISHTSTEALHADMYGT
jgi:hypothetical protein